MVLILKNKIKNLYDDKDIEKVYDYVPPCVQLIMFFRILGSVAHWVFAVKYLEGVLKLPLVTDPDQEGIEQKRKRVNNIINAANFFFAI